MSAYEPGTVAMVAYDGEPERVMLRVSLTRADDEHLAWIDSRYKIQDRHDRVQSVRPLVVLDPEDREQMDKLTASIVEAANRDGNYAVSSGGLHPTTTAAALRELTKPPKPAEPTGLGAVVEDVEGVCFVLAGEGPLPWVKYDDHGTSHDYKRIDAVRVLSAGVQP